MKSISRTSKPKVVAQDFSESLQQIWTLAATAPWALFADPDYDRYCQDIEGLHKHAEKHFCLRAMSIVRTRLEVVWGNKAAAFVLTRQSETIPNAPIVRETLAWLGRFHEVESLHGPFWNGINYDMFTSRDDPKHRVLTEELERSWSIYTILGKATRMNVDSALDAKSKAMRIPHTSPAFWFQLGALLEQRWPWQVEPLQTYHTPPTTYRKG